MKKSIHLVVDRSPELPYFILALYYLSNNGGASTVHMFSTAFLFVVSSLILGILLKTLLKTQRPVDHYKLPGLKYDFPSLHSLISIGTIVFIYYVNPLYSIILLPVGLFYLYSRLEIKAHTVSGVIGGALIGLVVGTIFGYSLDKFYLPSMLEFTFSLLLFLLPLSTTLFRIKYGRKLKI